jgi:hypothetical protein
MGDNRQINFGGLWFYTHWNGWQLGIKLRDAIKVAKPRWDDAPYCFRIILGELLKEYVGKETGAGLDFNYQESDYKNRDFQVDIKSNSLLITEPDGGPFLWSFSQFIELSDEEVLKI